MNIPIKPQKLTYSVAEAAEALRLIPIKGLERWVEEQAQKGWNGRYIE